MMDLATLQYVNRKATRAAAKRRAVPCIWSGTTDGFRLQFVGDRCPRDWKKSGRDDLFVDHSGWGAPGELALTQQEMLAELKTGMGYGIIESGQFQSYVREFIPTGVKK